MSAVFDAAVVDAVDAVAGAHNASATTSMGNNHVAIEMLSLFTECNGNECNVLLTYCLSWPRCVCCCRWCGLRSARLCKNNHVIISGSAVLLFSLGDSKYLVTYRWLLQPVAMVGDCQLHGKMPCWSWSEYGVENTGKRSPNRWLSVEKH